MKKLLDIGAGNEPKQMKGYKTMGMDSHDFSADYEKLDWAEYYQHSMLDTPYRFPENSIDMIYSHHALEHLPHQVGVVNTVRLSGTDVYVEGVSDRIWDERDALVMVINEIGRILKPQCEAHLIVPWMEHTNAWRHPAHYRFFNYDIFNWFSMHNKTPDHEAYGYTNKMEITRNEIIDDCHIYCIMRKP